jgi:hypothetical protein
MEALLAKAGINAVTIVLTITFIVIILWLLGMFGLSPIKSDCSCNGNSETK